MLTCHNTKRILDGFDILENVFFVTVNYLKVKMLRVSLMFPYVLIWVAEIYTILYLDAYLNKSTIKFACTN